MCTAVSEPAERRIAPGDPDPKGVLMKKGSHRLWLGVAAVAVIGIAVPAAFAGVVKYDTTLDGHKEGGGIIVHGFIKSGAEECVRKRQVILFEVRHGADRKVDTDRSTEEGDWGFNPRFKGRAYVKVTRAERDGYVCRADREPNHGAWHVKGRPLPRN
jgi:hypothetical protein